MTLFSTVVTHPPVECRIQSWEVWNTKSPTDWMPTHTPTELSRIKQTLNCLLDFTADWPSYLALEIYMFVVVNIDVLASDFRIERRHVVFLCYMQDLRLGILRRQIASRLNAHSRTDWAIENQAKTWTQQPVPIMNEAYSPCCGNILVCYC